MTTSAMFDEELAVGIDTVRKAAQLCQAVQATLSPGVLEKKDRSPVTVADFGSQALICAALREAFAEDPVIAEESSALLRQPEQAPLVARVLEHLRPLRPDADAEALFNWLDRGRTRSHCARFWTLDPIDGTKGFLRREQYAISLALIIDGRVEVGVLGCPNLPAGGSLDAAASTPGAIFFAVRGRGAFMQPLHGGGVPVPIHVSRCDDVRRARFCESVEAAHSAHDEAAALAQRLGLRAKPLRLDSQAKYALLSRGDAELYLRLPTRSDYREKLWDHAGGALVLIEAGGTVTDIDGKPLDFTQGAAFTENRGVFASNGRLHAQVLHALRSLELERHRDAGVHGDESHARRVS